jgi:hypothetical protein
MIRRVVIVELAEGWRVEGLAGYRVDVRTRTAEEALELIHLKDRLTLIVDRVAVVTDIAWQIRTGIGRKAMNDAKERVTR